MRNPFKTEAAAFRFLMLTIGYFGLIGIASVINKWAGLAVFLLLDGWSRRLVALGAKRRTRSR